MSYVHSLPTDVSSSVDRDGLVGNAVDLPVRGICPHCGQVADRVHSRHVRRIADLPADGCGLVAERQVVRLFCENPHCSSTTFTVRIPGVTRRYARRTDRLENELYAIAMECGAEGGARLAKKLAMPISPDTLLRILRRRPIPTSPTPRVLGVDDWAFRKRHTYGTILCDLERQQVIDLLPDRSAESFTNWLRSHPGVEIISRDRGGPFEKGAALGAPEAIQVADRWHLLTNLREALVRLVQHRMTQVHEAEKLASTLENAPTPTTVYSPQVEKSKPVPERRENERRRASQQRREARYQEIMELKNKGYSLRRISRVLGMSRNTVRRYASSDACPIRACGIRHRTTDLFTDYLRKRWQEGCHSARQLTDELRQQQGFQGSYDMVSRRVRSWRTQVEAPPAPSDPVVHRHSPNQVAWSLLKPPAEDRATENAFLQQLWQVSPSLAEASRLARQFHQLLCRRDATALTSWLETARKSVLKNFADSISSDLAAVTAALSQPWSNGQVEGQVNRLKMIKRQMYGRASFDLLRLRVLAAA